MISIGKSMLTKNSILEMRQITSLILISGENSGKYMMVVDTSEILINKLSLHRYPCQSRNEMGSRGVGNDFAGILTPVLT